MRLEKVRGQSVDISKKKVKKIDKKSKLCHRTEFWIRSDGIIENFLQRQGAESSRSFFRSDAVVVIDRIPLVGVSVERPSEECRSVALPPTSDKRRSIALPPARPPSLLLL